MHPRAIPRALHRVTMAAAAIAIALSALVAVPQASTAATFLPDLPGSIADGGYLISDAEFYRSGSLTEKQVQSFLEARVPTCKAKAGSPTCLRSFTADLPAKAADSYCAAVKGMKKAKASTIITTIAKACGINPKVILVMLQKEQGLVTSTAPSEWSYRSALGMSCPDTAPCSAAAAGFVNQVYKGTRQLQVYKKSPGSFRYKAGQTNTIQWHPSAACGTSQVHIKNVATASLYNYTPYRPSVAAISAGWGGADSCSTYGNRNFVNYYRSWFLPKGSPAAAPLNHCASPAARDITAGSSVRYVGADDAIARTAPNAKCTTGGATKVKGEKLSVIGSYAGWLRVPAGNKVAWIPASQTTTVAPKPAPATSTSKPTVKPAPKPAPKPTEKALKPFAQVTAKKVALKQGASGSSKTVLTLAAGKKVTVSASNGTWRKVAYGSKTGWVSASALKAPLVTKKVTTALNLRSTASTKGKKLATMRKGATVTVLGKSGAWVKVKYGSKTGWAHGSYLR
ncbi:SH3 domain-containing protein [Microbacterium sp. 77mftsu3.1]|uniref:SH3 domain-containing protein n=1 Tax=Microbacterium sp. 77mftsu3.1 TaxID=1761802 RepID=UPI0003A3C3FC|nr:SH3 domain-containing protein [Microbacterium sp. 77mftsu3.1]SDH43698.1 SH3 domain-containing protein [Microbacterium sp. 77mftsu3.1]